MWDIHLIRDLMLMLNGWNIYYLNNVGHEANGETEKKKGKLKKEL